jgi:hypothetical protein
VLKALQGPPEAGALWEKHINKILDDLDIVRIIHERSVYQGTINGEALLLFQRVDDITVACSDPNVAQGLITANIAKYSWSILNWAARYMKECSQRLAERLSHKQLICRGSLPSVTATRPELCQLSIHSPSSDSLNDTPRVLSVRRST